MKTANKKSVRTLLEGMNVSFCKFYKCLTSMIMLSESVADRKGWRVKCLDLPLPVFHVHLSSASVPQRRDAKTVHCTVGFVLCRRGRTALLASIPGLPLRRQAVLPMSPWFNISR